MAAVGMVVPVVGALVAGLIGIVLLFVRAQASQYSQHVRQLQPTDPAKEKRSKAPREFRAYTRAEVAEHNKADDAWIIVRNQRTKELRVYDVTEYVDEHPGGESILAHVGGEATEGFHGPQHPDAVFVMAETYCIGKVEEEEQAEAVVG